MIRFDSTDVFPGTTELRCLRQHVSVDSVATTGKDEEWKNPQNLFHRLLLFELFRKCYFTIG